MLNRILVASYTNSIYTLHFNPDTLSLTQIAAVDVGHQPSWIATHPSDTTLVFAALEQSDGQVVAVKYASDYTTASVLATAPTNGQDPCCLLATRDELLIANYSSGSISIIPISSKPPFILSAAVIIQLFGKGPNDQRQRHAHAHQVLLDDAGVELLVADLGSDRVCRFTKATDSGAWVLQGSIRYQPGSGPRHAAIHDGALYTLCELDNTLVKHRFHALPAQSTHIATKPTLLKPPPNPHAMLAAELLIPKPNSAFPTAYAYVSNRNDPSPEGDTIAIFGIEGDALELVTEVHTGLCHLRGMQFGGPQDKWLIAGGVNGGGVKVFERTDGGKGLKEIANADVSCPTGFLWV
ncbi:putative isomerase YbhE [Mycena kentingensis (nom. inval.)]|nr:putative isomerase YbhE [Mycena kentingensis (nom. inval.)]